MSDYESVEDLYYTIDAEGLAYFICDYANWADITVQGEPLPEEIQAAGKALKDSSAVIERWLEANL